MRHIAHVLGMGTRKHIKHPLVKHHIKKQAIRHIVGRGTPTHKKDEMGGRIGFGLKPLKFRC